MPEMLNRPRDQRFLFLLIHGIATYSQEPRSPSPRTTSFGYQLFQIGPNKRETITDGRRLPSGSTQAERLVYWPLSRHLGQATPQPASDLSAPCSFNSNNCIRHTLS